MNVAVRRLAVMAALGTGLALSSPGLAQAAAAIPEPTDLTLLSLGVAGLIVGRYAARRRRID